jgi:transcriptional regulator with XRE-family HTH domain
MKNLSDYLNEQRGRAARLSARSGIGKGHLSAIKSGQSRPSPDVAKRIEAATDGEVSAASLLGLEEPGARFEHRTVSRSLNDGRWAATVDPDGGLYLEPGMIVALGFVPGERLVFKPLGESVRMSSSDKALARIRTELRALVPEGVSLVDEFIAEKRAEAARE